MDIILPPKILQLFVQIYVTQPKLQLQKSKWKDVHISLLLITYPYVKSRKTGLWEPGKPAFEM